MITIRENDKTTSSNNIEVITLPSHLTYVLKAFDGVPAKTLKAAVRVDVHSTQISIEEQGASALRLPVSIEGQNRYVLVHAL
jgi:hypothetical protein